MLLLEVTVLEPGQSELDLRSPEGFRALAQANRDALLRVATRMLDDEHAAEDAVQEAFVRAFSARASFRGASSPRTWLFGVLLNVVRRELRGRRVRGWFGLDRIVEAERDQPPGAALERAEQESALRAAIATLTTAQREALVLVSLEGLSVGEAAQAQGSSPAAIWQALSRGRAALRRKLGD